MPRQWTTPYQNLGPELRTWLSKAMEYRHICPSMFDPATLAQLIDLAGNEMGSHDALFDVDHTDTTRADQLHEQWLADGIALDWAITDLIGNKWGGWHGEIDDDWRPPDDWFKP